MGAHGYGDGLLHYRGRPAGADRRTLGIREPSGTRQFYCASRKAARRARVLSTVFNDAVSKESLIVDGLLGGQWDSMGYWDADSMRNILLYVVPGAIIPLVVGVILFPQHAEIVGSACQMMRGAGLDPPICPAA